jgi:hypothetical protein
MALGSNIYSWQTGQKVIRFLLTEPSGALVDLSTVRLAFDLKNNDGSNPLTLTGNSLMCLFSRLRIRIGGQQVEDSLWHNRLVAMLMKLLPPARNWSASMEGLGGGEGTNPFTAGATTESIAANGSRHCISAHSRLVD